MVPFPRHLVSDFERVCSRDWSSSRASFVRHSLRLQLLRVPFASCPHMSVRKRARGGLLDLRREAGSIPAPAPPLIKLDACARFEAAPCAGASRSCSCVLHSPSFCCHVRPVRLVSPSARAGAGPPEPCIVWCPAPFRASVEALRGEDALDKGCCHSPYCCRASCSLLSSTANCCVALYELAERLLARSLAVLDRRPADRRCSRSRGLAAPPPLFALGGMRCAAGCQVGPTSVLGEDRGAIKMPLV